jgi:murein DD-endopeptidase MepM/ murein hydrolase activator NlpD
MMTSTKQFRAVSRLLTAVAATSAIAMSSVGLNLLSMTTPLTSVAQAASCDTKVYSVKPFTGKAAPAGVNVRSGPSLNASIIGKLRPNESRTFDAYQYGDEVKDIWSGKGDQRWYKLQGSSGWVASGVVFGNPSPNPSLQPTCPVNNPGTGGNTGGQVDMAGLQKLLYGTVRSTLTSPYGYQRCDIWGGIYGECRHPALDLAGPHNTQIYSPIDGVVIRTTSDNGTVGVYNQKANITFFFSHLNSFDVSLNQQVTKGQKIGKQGTRGHVTGSHLHFEARPIKTYYMGLKMSDTINPLDAVNRANR